MGIRSHGPSNLARLAALCHTFVRAANISRAGFTTADFNVAELGGVTPVRVDSNTTATAREAHVVDDDMALMACSTVATSAVKLAKVGGLGDVSS